MANTTGLLSLRDYLAGKGATVDYNKDTGVMVNGKAADISGLKNVNNQNYGTKEQLDALLPSTPINTTLPQATLDYAPDTRIPGLQDQLLNFKVTDFNPDTSKEFQQYKQEYGKAGTLASENTMGQAAAMTGGRSSSYSSAVAAEAKQGWDQKLMNIIPDLQAADRSRQLEDYNRIASQLSMLQSADTTNYNMARDKMSDQNAANETNINSYLSTIGQFSDNFQQEINNVKNDGDPTNDWQIPYLTSSRQTKLDTNAATAKADAATAKAEELDAQDRARKILVEDRNYALDKQNTNSLIANRSSSGSSSSKIVDINTLGTPEQLKIYADYMNIFSGNGPSDEYKGSDGIQKAYKLVTMGQATNISSRVGPELYKRMVDTLKQADTVQGQPTTTGSITNVDYQTNPRFVQAKVDAKNGGFSLQDVMDSKADIIADFGGGSTGDAAYREILTAAQAFSTKSTGSTSTYSIPGG